MAEDSFDIDTFLRLECNSHQQQEELERVIGLAQDKVFEILSLLQTTSTGWSPKNLVLGLQFPPSRVVQLAYRKKSLLLHPDKNPDDRSQECFEKVDKAKKFLLDSGEEYLNWRKEFLLQLRDARNVYLTSHWKRKIKTVVVPEDGLSKDPIVRFVQENTLISEDLATATRLPDIVDGVLSQIKKMKEEELRRESLREKNENERLKQQQDKAASDRKRKADHEKEWEETRDKRVQSWKSFNQKQGKGKKKSKKTQDGLEILG